MNQDTEGKGKHCKKCWGGASYPPYEDICVDEQCKCHSSPQESWKEFRDSIVGNIYRQEDKRAIRNLIDATLPDLLHAAVAREREEIIAKVREENRKNKGEHHEQGTFKFDVCHDSIDAFLSDFQS